MQIQMQIQIYLIIVILLLIYLTYTKITLYNESIAGMYVASEEFLKKAEIDGFNMFIGDGFLNKGAYFIIHKDEKLLANRKINIKFSPELMFYTPVMQKEVCFKVTIDEEQTEDMETKTIPLNDIMPSEMDLYYDITMGRLSLKGLDPDGEEKLYAEMFQQTN